MSLSFDAFSVRIAVVIPRACLQMWLAEGDCCDYKLHIGDWAQTAALINTRQLVESAHCCAIWAAADKLATCANLGHTYTTCPLIPHIHLYHTSTCTTHPLIPHIHLYHTSTYTTLPLIPHIHLYDTSTYTTCPLIPHVD